MCWGAGVLRCLVLSDVLVMCDSTESYDHDIMNGRCWSAKVLGCSGAGVLGRWGAGF